MAENDASENNQAFAQTVTEVVDKVMAVLRGRAKRIPHGARRVVIDGLHAPVRIAIDAKGAAHIRSETETDVYFAQGYITASDRLWQMDLLRRMAAGRAAEILGEPLLESDKHFLTYGFEDIAAGVVKTQRADVAVMLDAYAAGVNRCIERFRKEGWPWEFTLLEYEPEPWSPADTILVTKLQAEALSTSWLNDILREEFVDLPEEIRAQLFDETSPLDVIVFGDDEAPKRASKPPLALAIAEKPAHRAQPCIEEVVARKRVRAGALRFCSLYSRNRAASNNWVISGARTVSGAPILANDPHLQVAVPGIWHMAHLTCKDVDVAGVTIPGVPGILIGHNQDVAWGVTNVGADVQDLYWEHVYADNPDYYMTPNGPQKFVSRTRLIRVRTGPNTSNEVSFTCRATRHGPVVFEARGDVYALSWPALDPARHDLPAFYDLNRARNLDEIRAALKSYDGPPQNFAFATCTGDIGAQIAGCLFARRNGAPGLPRDGSTAQETAPKNLTFDELPFVHNPESGVIVTANNRTVGLDYPYRIAHEWSAPYRARRIFDLLRGAKHSDIAFSLAIQGDTFSYADLVFVTEVVRMARCHAVVDARWRAMIAIFGEWEGSTRGDSVATTVSAFMRRIFARRVLSTVLDAERVETYLRWDSSFHFIDQVISQRLVQWLPQPFESYTDLVLACFEEAVATLSARYGTEPSAWRWDKVSNPVVFAHPLSNLLPGVASTLRYHFPNRTGGGGPTVDAGAFVSMRFVADLSDWDETRLGLPLGQSGDIRSSNFADQLQNWLHVAPSRFLFSSIALAEASALVELTPSTLSPKEKVAGDASERTHRRNRQSKRKGARPS